MEEVAQVYARALFEVASENGALDVVREQLAQFADVLASDRELEIFFFSPYFSTVEKAEGLSRMVTGADPTVMNFLETLIERQRMPVVFRIRQQYEEMWDAERKLLPVEITSAVTLDDSIVESIGAQIGTQTGSRIQLKSVVDPDILGGVVLRVGNFVLDASIRNRLNQLRKQVAHAQLPSSSA